MEEGELVPLLIAAGGGGNAYMEDPESNPDLVQLEQYENSTGAPSTSGQTGAAGKPGSSSSEEVEKCLQAVHQHPRARLEPTPLSGTSRVNQPHVSLQQVGTSLSVLNDLLGPAHWIMSALLMVSGRS